MTTSRASTPGTVYLVGAGPGDPGLVTVRGVECLRAADVVLYDYLVNPAIVEHASPGAEIVSLGRPGAGRSISQDDIIARMIEEARESRCVVRLKGGDPSVFGRGPEEADALRDAGIPYEIVPGITTGLAVAAYTEIPITHRDDASAVALIAGRERDDRENSALDYQALAAFPGTLIFYMGVRRAEEWSEALIEHGKRPETPVGIIRWCTRTQQETFRCTLDAVAETVDANSIRPPSVFVVGEVVRRAPDLSWFSARPLFGARILVPSSQATGERLRHRLSALGADVLLRPVLLARDPEDWAPLDAALDDLDSYDWLVFTSGNGVDYLLKRLSERGEDVRSLGGLEIAVVGQGTAERLAAHGVSADRVPEEFSSEGLARALVDEAEGKRFLVARTTRGRQVLAPALERAGGEVLQVVAYESVDVKDPDPEVSELLTKGEIDWIVVTSSATARALDNLYGSDLGSARLASISPLTSGELREIVHEATVEASPHTVDGVVSAILNSYRRGA